MKYIFRNSFDRKITKDRKMNDLEGVSTHIHGKISSLKHLLDLSDVPQNKMRKLGEDVRALARLLGELESCVGRQKEQLKQLKVLLEYAFYLPSEDTLVVPHNFQGLFPSVVDLEDVFQKYPEDLQHMSDHIPAHMPCSKVPPKEPAADRSGAAELQPSEQDHPRKPDRTFVREMEFLTVPEFDSIPQYMKGRVTYEQLNAAVQNINTAVKAKYRILQQPLKSLNNHSRKLQTRFKEQETKGTKGQHFVVEDDIRELVQIKVDKRFQGMLNMLRHCQRLRELRGGGLTRFILL